MFKTDEISLNWLVCSSLTNIKNMYVSSKIKPNIFEGEMLNVFFMISHFSLSDKQEVKVLEQLDIILKSSLHNISFYDSLIEYLTIRFNNSKASLPPNQVKSILDGIIDKITMSSGYHEKLAITQFGNQNIYSILNAIGIVYDDDSRIDAILSTLNDYPISERIKSAKTIMYGLFRITQGKNNKKIKKAMLDVIGSADSKNVMLSYELFLVAIDILRARQELPSDIEFLIESIDKKITYSTEVLGLQELLNHIVKKRGLKDFSKALRKIKKITSRFNHLSSANP